MNQKQHIIEALNRIHQGRLIEIRALNVPHNGRTITMSGYFDDYVLAAEAAIKAEKDEAEGVYVTLNQIHTGLLARSPNRMEYNPKHTTSDRDVVRRRWMLLDVDPVRPSGISSTEDELAYAIQIRNEIAKAEFKDYETIKAVSGNGAHLLVAGTIDREPDEIVDLEKLATAYNDDRVSIDTSTGNLSRITRLYGTRVRKGYSIADRPHRMSYLEDLIEGGER